MLNLPQIKGVIFDLDGVLVDAEKLHYLAWLKVLKPFGVNLSKKEFCAFAGKQIDIIAGELIEKYKLKRRKEKLVLQRRKIAFEIFKNASVKIMPDAKRALEFFSKKFKIKIGLASGSTKKIAVLKLKNADLYRFFSVIVAGDDVKKGKPHPDTYLLALKKLKLRPEECLAFEDTQYGVESAKSAGLFCFAVPNGYSCKQDFSRADKVCKSLKEAIDHIKKREIYAQ